MVDSISGVGGLNHMHCKIEFVDDTLQLSEEFKKNVAIPYFKDIYKDLVQQSDKKDKGVNKVSFLTVKIVILTLIVFLSARHHWRKAFLSTGFEQRCVYRLKGIRSWVFQDLLF